MYLCTEVSPKHLQVALEDSLTWSSPIDTWKDSTKLWLWPSWLKALNLLNITHTNSPDLTGTQYLVENNTEYLFIVAGSVISSPSQTLFPSPTIKMGILTWYQVVHYHGSIKSFYVSHSCRNYFSSSLSVKTIYHNFLIESFFMVYRNHIGPQDWKKKPKNPLAAYRWKNLFNSLKA